MTALTKEIVTLSDEERESYLKHIEHKLPSLAPATSAKFFQLFLNGYSTVEISKMNPGFGLGMIVKNRIEAKWDEQRENHLQHLLDNVRQTTQKTQFEAIRFVSDGISVFQKLVGEKFKNYLQSSNIDDLGEFKDISFKQYKDLLELLLKLTGQENLSSKKISADITHRHMMEDLPEKSKPMSSSEAANLLMGLNEEGK
jgi:hypothetical protein